MLMKWRRHERGGENWEPTIRFSSGSGTTAPRDYLTDEECTDVREAALEYGTVPHYKSLTSEERDHWKTYVAQRLDNPKADVPDTDVEALFVSSPEELHDRVIESEGTGSTPPTVVQDIAAVECPACSRWMHRHCAECIWCEASRRG